LPSTTQRKLIKHQKIFDLGKLIELSATWFSHRSNPLAKLSPVGGESRLDVEVVEHRLARCCSVVPKSLTRLSNGLPWGEIRQGIGPAFIFTMTENKVPHNSDSTGHPRKLAWEKPEMRKLSIAHDTSKVHPIPSEAPTSAPGFGTHS
jgi:hypothetical protein